MLARQVDLIVVGGPPCQGFSTAGKRNPAAPHNKMTEQYLAQNADAESKNHNERTNDLMGDKIAREVGAGRVTFGPQARIELYYVRLIE